MNFPNDYKYAKEHTWIKLLEDGEALVGITEFAQSELGEIVYVDLPPIGANFEKDQIFGSVEAIKTTSDLFLPASGKIIEINKQVVTNPELVNSAPFTDGWMIKLKLTFSGDLDGLLDATAYQKLVS